MHLVHTGCRHCALCEPCAKHRRHHGLGARGGAAASDPGSLTLLRQQISGKQCEGCIPYNLTRTEVGSNALDRAFLCESWDHTLSLMKRLGGAAQEACTLLAHRVEEGGGASRSRTLRLALLQHVFLRRLPRPLPLHHPRRLQACLWAGPGLALATQREILRLLLALR